MLQKELKVHDQLKKMNLLQANPTPSATSEGTKAPFTLFVHNRSIETIDEALGVGVFLLPQQQQQQSCLPC